MQNFIRFFLLFYAALANANDVSITLTGEVSRSQVAFIQAGDAFNLTFTYSVDSQGGCAGGLSFSYGYRCTGNVLSASATIGNITFQFPPSQSFPQPIGDRNSLLQTANDFPNSPYDQFQGNINFENTKDIILPIIGFYLEDDSASFFQSAPKMITNWTNGDEGDIKHFDRRDATLYSFDSVGNYAKALADINLSPNAIYAPVVPVPASFWLFISGILSIPGLKVGRLIRKI